MIEKKKFFVGALSKKVVCMSRTKLRIIEREVFYVRRHLPESNTCQTKIISVSKQSVSTIADNGVVCLR